MALKSVHSERISQNLWLSSLLRLRRDREMGATHFLMKRLPRVKTETALHVGPPEPTRKLLRKPLAELALCLTVF